MASAHPNLFVVLDGDYSDRLEAIAGSAPVWIIDSPSNKNACERLRKRQPHRDHREVGAVTSFTSDLPDHPFETFLAILPQLETHHGVVVGDYLRLPPGFVIELIGIRATKDTVTRLSESALEVVDETPDGLRVTSVAI